MKFKISIEKVYFKNRTRIRLKFKAEQIWLKRQLKKVPLA